MMTCLGRAVCVNLNMQNRRHRRERIPYPSQNEDILVAGAGPIMVAEFLPVNTAQIHPNDP